MTCLMVGASAKAERVAPSKPRVVKRVYGLKLGSGWRRLAVAKKAAPGLHTRAFEAHRHTASGRRLAVTRTGFPNYDARRRLGAYMKLIETGLRSQPGYKRLRRSKRKLGRIPIVEFVFRRRRAGASEVVVLKLMLYRSWSYALTLVTPARNWKRWRRRNRKLIKTFRPRRRR